ncbi:hypothetical protein L208DRAFT_1343263 [Tricholoma matsutake]|nr:hypothetical protein L208DRAFT_1343263 [Tricholoma matsutake 945]
MGRPRLYHTPDEKQTANWAKSHKHYQRNNYLFSSNKCAIQCRRQAKYQKDKAKTRRFVFQKSIALHP